MWALGSIVSRGPRYIALLTIGLARLSGTRRAQLMVRLSGGVLLGIGRVRPDWNHRFGTFEARWTCATDGALGAALLAIGLAR